MASSLENLVDATDTPDFKITKSEFGNKTNTILCKGVYAYEYNDSQERFNEKELPCIDKFYSSLNNENISTKDYK